MSLSPFPPKLGQYLRECRIAAGKTQNDISEALNFSTAQFISNFERGLCGLPYEHWEMVIKLCKADKEKVRKICMDHYSDLYDQVLGL